MIFSLPANNPEYTANWKPLTVSNYSKQIKKHLIPRLGAAKLEDLDTHTIQLFYNSLTKSGLAPKTVPLDILLYAGNLAVYHSKARRNGQADLYYTQVKYLRRAKNGPKGLVLPTQEKNLLVKIDEQRLRKLDELEKSAQSI